MDVVLKYLNRDQCWVFLDDVINYFKTIEESAARLEIFVQRFEKVKFQLKSPKCIKISRVLHFLR
jgi:hypothetical protein